MDKAPADTLPDAAVQDQGDVVQAVKNADLINLFNYVNFREGTVFVGFSDTATGESVSIPATPQPTSQDLLACRWLPPGLPPRVMTSFQLKAVVVNDGRHVVLFQGETVSMDREQVVLRYPEYGSRRLTRSVVRHPAREIAVDVLQNGLRFRGNLMDFSAVSFSIDVELRSGQTFHGLSAHAPVTVLFEREGSLLFSGECRMVRRQNGRQRGTLVLTLNGANIQRFPPKQVRSIRQVLRPAPMVNFVHPLTGKAATLRMVDLSGGGFAVEEFFENSSLLPGLILPHIVVELGGQRLLETAAQVLYRNVVIGEGGRSTVRCGVVFLDMSLDDQARLAALLHQARNERMRVSSPVDMDELWRFFFESGFLYPSKYAALEESKAHFKSVYEKLYLNSPDISRHFLYHDKGLLFAHMSMLRAYPETWLIHHHAASKDGYGLAGVAVLDQAGQYLNEFHQHPSTHMDYVMCYFRKENKFPNRVFGGSASDVGDPKGISLDEFAYLHLSSEWDQPAVCQILPVSDDDLSTLARFYESVSGGLMLEAMNLRDPMAPDDELSGRYAKLGFRRKNLVFSFHDQGILKAIITLQLTELGLNLSNLTNCFHALVVDSSLAPEVLLSGLRKLGQQYTHEDLPLLLYPANYLDGSTISAEKNYTLWVMSMTHLDGYFHSIQRRFRRGGSE